MSRHFPLGLRSTEAIVFLLLTQTGLAVGSETFLSLMTKVSSVTDTGRAIAVNGAGDVYVAARSNDNPVTFITPWIGKYSADLTIKTSTTFTIATSTFVDDIVVDKDNNIIMTGSYQDLSEAQNIWVRKYDPDLTLLATTTLHMSEGEFPRETAVDGSGALYVVGEISFVCCSASELNMFLSKFDSSLVIQSTVVVSGAKVPSADSAQAIVITPQDDIFVTGYIEELAGMRAWVAKYNQALVLQSSRTFDAGNIRYSDMDMAVHPSGNIFIVIYRQVPVAGLLFKLSPDLEVLSSRNLLGVPTAISIGDDGNIIVTGKIVSGGNTSIERYDQSLSLLSAISVPGSFGEPGTINDSAAATGAAYFVGYMPSAEGDDDLWLSRHVVPSPVTGFRAETVTQSTITWAWNDTAFEASYSIVDENNSPVSAKLPADAVQWTESGLTAGTTYRRAIQAMNHMGTSSASLADGSTLPNISTGIGKDGGKISLQLVTGEVSVEIPEGAFDQNVGITVQSADAFPSDMSLHGKLKGIGIGIEITPDSDIQPSKKVSISIQYRDVDVASVDESNLIIARYDNSRNVWIPLESSVDVATNKVVAGTDHFSLFQIMQASASPTLSNIIAFPNPLRPSRGDSDMSIAGLTAEGSVRIYTILGEEVQEIKATNTGVARWDGKNKSGHNVASGIYLAIIHSDGQNKVIKIAVER